MSEVFRHDDYLNVNGVKTGDEKTSHLNIAVLVVKTKL